MTTSEVWMHFWTRMGNISANLNRDDQCPGRGLNREPAEYTLRTLSTQQRLSAILSKPKLQNIDKNAVRVLYQLSLWKGAIYGLTMNVAIFRDITLCSPHTNRSFRGTYQFRLSTCCTLVLCSAEFLHWKRRYVLPRRRFTYELHVTVFKKTATITATAVRASNLITD